MHITGKEVKAPTQLVQAGMVVTKGKEEAAMLKQSSTLPASTKKVGANKLVLGFAALAATAVIGTTGVAAAQVANSPASGYGGNSANVDLNLNVNGSNNVITIVLNFFR